MRRVAAIGIAVLAGAAALAPSTARAATWTEAVPDSLHRFSLESIMFEGDVGEAAGDLKEVIRSSTSGLLRFRPVNLERVEGDVYRLRSHFRRQGYWNATVDRVIEFDLERRKTRVTFIIERGRQRIVGEIAAAGNQTFSLSEILSQTAQRSGQPFDYNRTARDRIAIENMYANRGFYEVQVTADIQPASGRVEDEGGRPDEPAAEPRPVVHDLVFRIVEGTRYRVGAVRIEGNEITQDGIILRELTFGPGDILNREELTESRTRLYATGYFSRVELSPQITEAERGRVDLVLRVKERKMRFVSAGIGLGTRDQLRVAGSWGHRNLWGRGKRAEIGGLVATEFFPETDLIRTRVETRYVEPWLFGTRTTGTAELFYERSREFSQVEEERVEYDLNLVGLTLNANRDLTRYTNAWVGLKNEWANVDAGEAAAEAADLDLAPDVTRTISTQIQRDRRDDYFNPEKGFLNRIIGSVSGGLLGGDNDFWKVQLESSWFRPFDSIVLAGRLRVGYERPFGPSLVVPDRERFKLGGDATVRGYREQEIGPGDFLLLGNIEARVPLFWILHAAFFLDGGNAWNSPSDVSWKDFRFTTAKEDPGRAAETEVRYAFGGGIRLGTPVGPVRLDYGRKLKILPVAEGRPEEDSSRWHLSLGHVF